MEEVAYVHWHRMLFARFLAENDLLMHPLGVPVTLEECEELAPEEGDRDKWETAARYAGNMLPGIFSADDPSVQVRFAPESRASLEAILSNLPGQVFTSDDGLGWTYQFWQSQKKNEVSSRGLKIEKLDLAAYSQLFTEDYMVRFLLENSLGAWWAARHPSSPLVNEFKFLRFLEDGTPAVGTFPSWPERASDITVMDPCCGSGHFLVIAFDMLRRMRMEEENLDESEAGDAVLLGNLYGLELDPRCVQIAAFALALAAWKVGGHRELPAMNIACSGIPVVGQLEAWTRLAAGDGDMKRTLERLHGLFVNAPDLGSLISPADVPVGERMFMPEFARVAPLLHEALGREKDNDPVAAAFGSSALGVARAAGLMSRQYTLVATNVPYLARDKQGDVLRDFVERRHTVAKADLATAFLERCRTFCLPGGAYAAVTPQNWLFLASYKNLRRDLLNEQSWHILARLGSGAFETISGEVVNVTLVVLANHHPEPEATHLNGVDVSACLTPSDKAVALTTSGLQVTSQIDQLRHPDHRIVIGGLKLSGTPLSRSADTYEGLHTGDYPRFGRYFWELPVIADGWEFQQAAPASRVPWGGRENVLFWENGNGALMEFVRERLGSDVVTRWIKGMGAWGKKGVAVAAMQDLRATLYDGELFTHGVFSVIPKDQTMLPALFCFLQSEEFRDTARSLDQKLAIARAVFDGVPFDAERWQAVADSHYPDGLPVSYSTDPTQWVFDGDPVGSALPLQVAAIRLLGYHWPQQEPDELSQIAVSDGMLPLSSVAVDEPAVERLRHLLSVAHGADWSPEQQSHLLRQVGFEAKGLDAWLRDGFFEQHCKLFHRRPFIWHIWDGRRDGFAVLVNYHRLDSANLDRLIYTYLGEWIRAQRAAEESGTPGANARLVAALELQQKLEWIRDGEPPYDIYVRWKPLHEQPIGWNPDLNDGVRLNIRPFVEAGVLRSRVNVKWNKDRGRDPDGSERVNDVHHTLSAKRAAREGRAE